MSRSVCAHLLYARDEQPSNSSCVVANEQGSFTTPSFVSFTSEERLIGEAAKNQAAMNPENTVFDVKYVFSSSLCHSGHSMLTSTGD
jgi:molecular chaperone DnaK (HSP70)